MLIPSTSLVWFSKPKSYQGEDSSYYAGLIRDALAYKKDRLLSWEVLQAKDISASDLIRIHQIEQDAWAHGIEEYLACSNCWLVEWKDKMYWRLPREVQKRTVSKIEELLWSPEVLCKCCGSKMSRTYGTEYMSDIYERYQDDESYLWVLRDSKWVIQGFIDGYVNDFSTIYRREFFWYYRELISQDDLREFIEQKLWCPLPNRILFWTSLAVSERHKSLQNVYKLLQLFFATMNPDVRTLCISEARIWTNISKVYSKNWAYPIWISEVIDTSKLSWKQKWVENDIFVQENIASAYQQALTMSARDFWRYCFR